MITEMFGVLTESTGETKENEREFAEFVSPSAPSQSKRCDKNISPDDLHIPVHN